MAKYGSALAGLVSGLQNTLVATSEIPNVVGVPWVDMYDMDKRNA